MLAPAATLARATRALSRRGGKGGTTAPGRVLQRMNGNILVPAGAAGEAFVALFDHTPIEVGTTADFTAAMCETLRRGTRAND